MSATLASGAFDLSVFFSGILCVGLTAIGRREGYLVGLYNSLSYSVLAYGNGRYGEVYLNLLFFVPTGIVGFIMWQRYTTPRKTVSMRQLAWSRRALIAAASAGTWEPGGPWRPSSAMCWTSRRDRGEFAS